MIALLYNIRSLHNVGSIFRTADGAGVEKLYLCGITPSPKDEFGQWRPQVSKVALGAEKNVPWEEIRSASAIKRLVAKLKKEKFKIWALEVTSGATPINKTPAVDPGRLALVFGHEVDGLPAAIIKQSDRVVQIPMRGTKESLNVSVAFGVAAYHCPGPDR